MLLRLFLAGQGDFKAVLRRRSRLLVLCIVLGVTAAAAGFTLEALGAPLPNVALGFYAGTGTGIALFGAVGLIAARRTLRNEKKLRAAEIKETDERRREVVRRAASAATLFLVLLTYVAMLVAIAVDWTVFFTLITVVMVFAGVFFCCLVYYDRKL